MYKLYKDKDTFQRKYIDINYDLYKNCINIMDYNNKRNILLNIIRNWDNICPIKKIYL